MQALSLDQPWGGGLRVRHQHLGLDGQLPSLDGLTAPLLPRGLGRSYGDVCVNDAGYLWHGFRRDHLLTFNPDTGILRCEGGVSLDDLVRTFLPRGWFPPVVPGTRFVTLAGAVANDVHGKNHASMGSFGCHVRKLRLRRSDWSAAREIGPGDPLFAATIGGLGLTGLIEEVELQMLPVPGTGIEQETLLFTGVAEYHALEDASRDWPYTVGWLDTLAPRLRGVFFRGRHAEGPPGWNEPPTSKTWPAFGLPKPMLGTMLARAFNAAYYRAQALRSASRQRLPVWPFFWPLDAIQGWNRIYGRSGFIQYQFVVPPAAAEAVITEVLDGLRQAGVASFLAVIKRFGNLPSPGLLSFPMPGTTLAIDLPQPNARTLELLDRFDRRVAEAGGRLYPAKDARMSASMFQATFPRWRELEALRDPCMSSSFWRRVTSLSRADSQ